MTKKINYSDSFQKNYSYQITEPVGKNFHPEFKPDLTPRRMLELGVFGGAYFIGVKDLIPSDIPKNWFKKVKISKDGKKNKELNFFKVNSGQSLYVWKSKGWINERHDPHGWFQWYCRYFLGRRVPKEDERQIKRWKLIRRHASQIIKNCRAEDLSCRPKQRQTLLHWAYDSRKI